MGLLCKDKVLERLNLLPRYMHMHTTGHELESAVCMCIHCNESTGVNEESLLIQSYVHQVG